MVERINGEEGSKKAAQEEATGPQEMEELSHHGGTRQSAPTRFIRSSLLAWARRVATTLHADKTTVKLNSHSGPSRLARRWSPSQPVHTTAGRALPKYLVRGTIEFAVFDKLVLL